MRVREFTSTNDDGVEETWEVTYKRITVQQVIDLYDREPVFDFLERHKQELKDFKVMFKNVTCDGVDMDFGDIPGELKEDMVAFHPSFPHIRRLREFALSSST